MVGTTEVLPVTKDQAVQTNISYAGKIGKQVVKSQINERIANLKVDFDKKKEEAEAVYSVGDLAKYLQEKFEMAIKNDGDITRLRRLLNKFSPHDEKHDFSDNMSFIHGDDTHSRASYIYMGPSDSRFIKELLEIEEVHISVILNVIPDVDGEYGHNCQFMLDIPICKEWMTKIKKQADLVRDANQIEDQMRELNAKLNNLDDLVEEMETKLLVSELNNSEEGKRVLRVASDLISNLVGETPEVLKVEI